MVPSDIGKVPYFAQKEANLRNVAIQEIEREGAQRDDTFRFEQCKFFAEELQVLTKSQRQFVLEAAGLATLLVKVSKMSIVGADGRKRIVKRLSCLGWRDAMDR